MAEKRTASSRSISLSSPFSPFSLAPKGDALLSCAADEEDEEDGEDGEDGGTDEGGDDEVGGEEDAEGEDEADAGERREAEAGGETPDVI